MTTKSFPLAAARALAMQRAWASDHSRKSFEISSARAVQFFGPLRPVLEIDRKQIEAWEEAMVSEKLAEATIDRCKSALLSCLLAAHRAGHVSGQFQRTAEAFEEGEVLQQYRAENWRQATGRLMRRRIEAWEAVVAAEGPLANATETRRAGFASTLIVAYRAGLLERVPPVMEDGDALDKYMARACRQLHARLQQCKGASS
jgi:hypothetical protein